MTEGNSSKEGIRSLIGSRIVCSLSDGRTTTGKFVCIDRLYVISRHIFFLDLLLSPLSSYPSFLVILQEEYYIIGLHGSEDDPLE